MHWTPDAIKAEVDYRQRRLRELGGARRGEHVQSPNQGLRPEPGWWRRLRNWAHTRRESDR